MRFEILPLGDSAVRVSFGDTIDEKINRQINAFLKKLEQARVEGIIECVPAYTTLTIYYEPDVIFYDSLINQLKMIHLSPGTSRQDRQLVYEIPVCYGGEYGEDLRYVAEYHGLGEQEVIDLHADREYLIYMMGFMPGFPYLGGLPENLAVPRLEKPRQSVKPGAVGIGGNQTGIYPADVPSGWRIIGTTPVNLFSPKKKEPFLLSSGHYIKFVPINKEQFLSIKKMGDTYRVKTYEKR
ncbi:5-oxoprolinase subunit PxpB [Bacillus sp. ISL-35]|uniref:5-oxoprolinase subunit PxpB n=1 Tax=Bacillus sp. ISL-35 TaxID=2819122 RepID=UPI001BE778D1|nr:5-oxoprolinase subunit PxpB [Bacillus sp. ISL-35]MBT2679668.1 5-oxoprolinase subunit PxpB [Bacillus sp. ISL-35]MBT2704701.1 5-oxoprolinase subunit PxpB [Chryseobacterium sp. ISL-80]